MDGPLSKKLSLTLIKAGKRVGVPGRPDYTPPLFPIPCAATRRNQLTQAALLLISGCGLLAEPTSVFDRSEKGLDHLSLQIVAIESVQLREPEVIAAQV